MTLSTNCHTFQMRRKISKIGGGPRSRGRLHGVRERAEHLKMGINTFMGVQGVKHLEAISFSTKHWLKPWYFGTILQDQCQILGGAKLYSRRPLQIYIYIYSPPPRSYAPAFTAECWANKVHTGISTQSKRSLPLMDIHGHPLRLNASF